jgi:hypothetical protein
MRNAQAGEEAPEVIDMTSAERDHGDEGPIYNNTGSFRQ